MPFDWFTMAAQMVNFLVLVWILKRVFYRPVLRAMAERQRKVQQTIQEAASEKEKTARERKTLQAERAELARHKDGMMQEAREEAQAERKRLLQETRREFAEARQRWRETLNREQDEFAQTLIRQARGEVLEVARKLLADLADSELQNRMVGKFTNNIKNLTGEDRQRLLNSLEDSETRSATVRSAFAMDPPARRAVEEAVGRGLGQAVSLNFETKPALVCGLELNVDGQKVAWSVEEYLRSLSLLVQELASRRIHPHEEPSKTPATPGC